MVSHDTFSFSRNIFTHFVFFLLSCFYRFFLFCFQEKQNDRIFSFVKLLISFTVSENVGFGKKFSVKNLLKKSFSPGWKTILGRIMGRKHFFLCVVLYFSFLKPSERVRFNRTFCLSSFFFFMVDQVESFSPGWKNFSRKDYGKKKNSWRKNERNIFFLLKEKY